MAGANGVPNGVSNASETTPLLPPLPPAPATATAVATNSVNNDKAAHFKVSPSKFWACFSGVLFSYALAFFDSTLTGSIHPVVTSHFHAANSASWLSTSFLLTATAFQPIFGRVSDTFGRRPVYLFAIVVFFVTTAWCGLAQSIGSFIAARACCGLGAGAVTSLGMIMTSDLVNVEFRGIYQSYVNIFYGLGSSLGLAVGGFIADKLGWRAAFYIQLPSIAAFFVLAYFTTPSALGPELAKNEGWTLKQAIKTIDTTGSFLLVGSVTFLMMGINLGGNVVSWSHPLVISSLVACLISIVLLLKVESTAERPVLPLKMLANPPRANLIFSNFFGNMATNTVLFNAPLFFQAVKQESPTVSGFRLLASSVGLLVTSVFTGFLVTRTRRMKPTLVLGGLFLIIGGITTGNLRAKLPGWLATSFLVPTSFGQGFAFPTTLISILAVSSQVDQAVATTTLGLFRYLGSVMGVAVSSWILQTSLLIFLNQRVTGPNKEDIIFRIRRSVTEISKLDPVHKAEVIGSYEQALCLTFASGVLWACLVLISFSRIKLPRLGEKP